ncbi:P-loop containing nucleoside triphosphate hydrolase protein, partial [Ephemerocybe angulata]
SYSNLEKARKEKEKAGYVSRNVRNAMEETFFARSGKLPYPWQLDVAEALLLGLNAVVIAGTGSGKTLPFMLPLLKDKTTKAVIISPLKVLQEDQVARFKAIGISAAAVNGDTWSPKLKEVPFLSDAVIANDVAMIVVDEAHCISQWGGDFRKEYASLDKLRAFFPTHVPFLATSATLTPPALHDLQNQLDFELDSAFFLNLGNDRHNITLSVLVVKSPKNYDAIIPLLMIPGAIPQENLVSSQQLRKSIVFVNTVLSAQLCRHHLKNAIGVPALDVCIDVLHAQRTVQAKRRVMMQFREGTIRVLVATEAAGMGADIPDIEQVIQPGVPASLSIWVQRAGRAGRSPTIDARAILLVEPSVFQSIKQASGGDEDRSSEDEDGEGDSDGDSDMQFRKKVEPALREYLEAKGCRRDVVDVHFGNPPGRKDPLGHCCDNCNPPPRPSTPVREDDPNMPTNTPGTPSRQPNENRKRGMDEKPTKRQREHLKAAKEALVKWCLDTKWHLFSPSSYTAVAIFPDRLLNCLASNTTISQLKELEAACKTPWPLGSRLFDGALAVVAALDQIRTTQQEEKKRQKWLETELRIAAATSKKEQEKEERERLKRERKEAVDHALAQKAEEKRLALLSLGYSSFSSSPGPLTLSEPSAPETFTYEVCLLLSFIHSVC